MSDLREQLRKAGLVSAKQLRQAKHQDRLHRAEVGPQGLEEERARRDREYKQQAEEKRRQDQEREELRRRQQAEEERVLLLQNRIKAGWIREATGGARRFFFVAGGGRITFLDLNDEAVRRLQTGSAAIAESRGAVRGEFCVIDGQAAASLARDHAELLRLWNRTPSRS